jgi:hypothetical protein
MREVMLVPETPMLEREAERESQTVVRMLGATTPC